jgi:hypothetical protein
VYLEESEHHAIRRDDPSWFGKRGMDPDLVPAVVALAHDAGLRVAAHVTSRHDFQVAVEAGVDEIAHLPLQKLEPEDTRAAAARGIVQVTTVLSHRPTDGIEDLDALHRTNLATLRAAGVIMVLGTDSRDTVVDEVMKLAALKAFEPNELVRMLVQDTPRWIFPQRPIGRFEAGAEASFLVLGSNPLEDLTALRDIQSRVKSGRHIALEAPDGVDRPGIGQQLVHSIMSQGVDSAIAEYGRLRAEEPDAWDFSEGQLEALGDALIRHGKVAEAVAILNLNSEQYPSSPRVWISLGKAQEQANDRNSAIANYRRALDLDPRNPDARERLAGLEDS